MIPVILKKASVCAVISVVPFPDQRPVSLHRAWSGRFQLDMPDETDYGRKGIDNNIENRCFFIGLQGPSPRSNGNSRPSPRTQRHSEALEPSAVVQ